MLLWQIELAGGGSVSHGITASPVSGRSDRGPVAVTVMMMCVTTLEAELFRPASGIVLPADFFATRMYPGAINNLQSTVTKFFPALGP